MSTKDTSQVIALPSGGGAIGGLGEHFAPDLHTGTGQFSVPLQLPAGRSGLQPQLQLAYSSAAGNGPFGLGWSLGLPGIQRKTTSGIPQYRDQAADPADRDTFVLSQAEDLVPVAVERDGRTRYRPRTEGLFARIIRHHDARNDYWEVRSKDGMVHYYGTPASAGHDPAVVADPADRSKVFSWQLTRTLDPLGNRIDYSYERDSSDADGHRWDQCYLTQIGYVEYRDEASGEARFLVSIGLEYDDRTDAFSTYRAGFEIRTRRLCRRIVVATHAEQQRLVRSYELDYAVDPHNGVALLEQLLTIGHDGAQTERLPALCLSYTSFAPQQRAFFPVEGPLPQSLASPDLALVDLFGSGLPDLLELNGVPRYWRNAGGGRFEPPRTMANAPAGLRLVDPGVQLIDADGDGRADLLVTSQQQAGYFPLRFGGLWDRRSFQPYAVAPSFNLEDPSVQLLDLDGDGVTDALRSGSRLECFFNDPRAGWHRVRQVERGTLDAFPNVDFADPRVKWADMSGDQLQSIVLVHDGSIVYWPNLGHGNWGRRIEMRNSPRLPRGYDPQRLLLGDVDGDGLADLVYVDHRSVTLWINQSGSRWSDPIEIRGTPAVADGDAVRLVDLLGNGISGLLWSGVAERPGRSRAFFLDFTGGSKPYLLHEMDNQLGVTMRASYVSSIKFYLQDRQRAATRWQTPLPFPVQVVARIQRHDALSGSTLTTEYSYHHGYWDGHEREFRGFGRVDQRDSEVFAASPDQRYAPPVETRTWFHQGPIGDEDGGWAESDFRAEYWPGDPPLLERPAALDSFLAGLPRPARRAALRTLRGNILRTEVYALDGSAAQDRPYTVTEALVGVREEEPPARPRIFFPQLLAQRTTQWERGDEPMTQLSFSDDYDRYGQPGTAISIAVPRGRDLRVAAAPGAPYLATASLTLYARQDSPACYIVDRVARQTSYEILNDGSLPLSELLDAIRDGTALRQVLGQALIFYDGPAFVGLPLGQLGGFGAPVRIETLVLTEALLHAAYRSGDAPLDPAALPPYLDPAAPTWTADYPQPFRAQLPALAGYCFYADADHERGYFSTTAQRRYDFQSDPLGAGRGLIEATRDPLGHETTVVYDRYALLPVASTDPAGLTTQAEYDYRMLQVRALTDPNGSRTLYGYTPLGLLASTALLGRAAAPLGDTPETPSTRLIYDFLAFAERSQPISVRTLRRMQHAGAVDVPAEQRDQLLESVEYSDGFGRLLQKRTQAEETLFGDPIFGDGVLPPDQSTPGDAAVGRQRGPDEPPSVVVSGWQVRDNKGRTIEQYEPFLSSGWEYQPPGAAQQGQKVTMFYDPRGQLLRSVNPDGSEQRVVYGVPHDLADPERFRPTPWEVYIYDANDNAGRTHGAGDAAHWNTPSSTVVDALGRATQSVERNGPQPERDWHVTRSAYDLRGNLLAVTDALGRVAFRYVYDLRPDDPETLRVEQIDAGVRRRVVDAAGNEIERRSSNDALVLQAYDQLGRPVRRWARDAAAAPLTLRERLVYGDSPDAELPIAQAQAAHLLGQLYQHYDEAGLLRCERYDFKGNLLEQSRQVVDDALILQVFKPAPANGWQVQPFRIDWQPPQDSTLPDYAATLLAPLAYRTSTSYDALSRVTLLHSPQAVDGARHQLRPVYNRAGALERIELDGTTFVERIAYNARGQRTLIAYGNGVMTRYAYERRTFRLARLRTEGYLLVAPLSYKPQGVPLQDYAYRYDLVGNLVTIHDRTPGSGIPVSIQGRDALDRRFAYDPLYRLVGATGRECDLPLSPPWDGRPRGVDLTRVREYSEQYHYDPLGNLLELHHQTPKALLTRTFALGDGGNRLTLLTTGSADFSYGYDASGNLVRETTSRHFEWDHSDRLATFRTQAGSAEPSVYVHYLYGADGQRVKKLVRKQGGSVEVTVYVDGLFEHQRSVDARGTRENNVLHLMDDQRRIALVRIGAALAGDATPAVSYHLGDHLASSNLVLDGGGALVNREEYTPYGETSFGSFSRKRYRFGGKERDDESGLAYHGMRYYAPWLARWACCDPAYTAAELLPEQRGLGLNLYAAFDQSPLRYDDPDGRQSKPAAPAPPKPKLGNSLRRIVLKALIDLATQELDPNDAAREMAQAVRDHRSAVTAPPSPPEPADTPDAPKAGPGAEPKQPTRTTEKRWGPSGKRGQRHAQQARAARNRWTQQGKDAARGKPAPRPAPVTPRPGPTPRPAPPTSGAVAPAARGAQLTGARVLGRLVGVGLRAAGPIAGVVNFHYAEDKFIAGLELMCPPLAVVNLGLQGAEAAGQVGGQHLAEKFHEHVVVRQPAVHPSRDVSSFYYFMKMFSY